MHPAMPLAMLLFVFAGLVFVVVSALFYFHEEDFTEALGFGFCVTISADVLLLIAWAITKTILGL